MAEAVQHLLRRQWLRRLFGVFGSDAMREADQPVQHVHEQAGERQIGPIGVGCHMKQHNPPSPARGFRHQRCAIGELGPDLRTILGAAEHRSRGCQHLPCDPHILRHRQTGKRRLRVEGRQRWRLRPGHRATELSVGLQQAHRQQRIGVGGEVGTGEADQRAAFGQEITEQLYLRRIVHHHIGQNQHRQIARQQRRQIALAQFCAGIERAADVIERADQRRIARPAFGQQPHRTATIRLIQQPDRPGGGCCFQYEAGERVGEFRRQIELGLCLLSPGIQMQHGAGEAVAVIALREHRHIARQAGGGAAQMRHQRACIEARRGEQQRRIGGADFHNRTEMGEGMSKRWIVTHPIGDIDHRAGFGLAEQFGGEGAVGGPGFGSQSRQTRAQFAGGHGNGECWRAGILACSGGEQRHLPPSGGSTVEGGFSSGEARRPRGGGGPAIVNSDQQRPLAVIRLAPAQIGTGEGDDHQGGRQQAQSEQPERCAGGGLGDCDQAAQQPDRREFLPTRRRRRHPQQPPQDRQQHQRQQNYGLREMQRGEYSHHRRPTASGAKAAASAIRAVVAGASVAWV